MNASTAADRRCLFLFAFSPLIAFAVTVTSGFAQATSSSGAHWPDRVYAPYVDMAWGDNPDLVKIAATGGKCRHLVLAFVNTNKGKPVWGNYAAYAVTKGDAWHRRIAQFRKAGGEIMVSFGGERGPTTEPAVAIKDETQIQRVYQEVIDAYDLRRLDFDIEGAAVRGPSVDRRSRVMKRLQDVAKSKKRALRIWLTLPVTPNGLLATGENVVSSAIKAGVELEGVNIMTMAYGTGPAKAADVVNAGEALAKQLRQIYAANGMRKSDSQLYKMVGVTPDASEMNEDKLRTILKWAKSRNVGRLSVWEVCPRHNHDMKKIISATKILASFTTRPTAESKPREKSHGPTGNPK